MKPLLTLLLLPFMSTAQSFEYLPATIAGHQVLEYTQFTLSYNEQHEQPDWVAYELTAGEVSMKMDRCNCFKTDKAITTESASKSDYKYTGFDIGHLSPAADNNLSEAANEESFLLSNMSPQIPRFNRGTWKLLEEWVGNQAASHGSIYVVTGPVFVNNLGSIGSNKVTIPGYFYKVLLRFEGDKVYSIGFILPQVGAIGTLKDYQVPVNTVETLTGLDFFPNLPDKKEESIESQNYTKIWGL